MTSSLPSLAAPWRIGVDVGGTFTDMVLRDAAGAVRIFKAPSVPADPSEGVLGVLRLAAQQLDLPLSALLRDCALFVHGSTVATNTILEKKGARVGMLTTEGFRDSLEIRRGIRENQWDHRAPFPEVLVPRYLRLPVRGRIGRRRQRARAAGRRGRRRGRQGVQPRKASSRSPSACSTPSSTARTSARPARSSATSWAGKWISLSSEVMPTMGEYERGSTAVVNAYIAPKVTSYLGALDAAAAPARPAALAAAAAEQRRRRLGRPGREPPGDAGAVRPGRRRRRAEGLRRRRASSQPDLDGDRRHQLRRHGDGQAARCRWPTSWSSTAITSPRRRSRSTPSARAAAPSPGSTMRACCMSARKAPARGPGPPPTGWAARTRP